jgi:hypothetical protein
MLIIVNADPDKAALYNYQRSVLGNSSALIFPSEQRILLHHNFLVERLTTIMFSHLRYMNS